MRNDSSAPQITSKWLKLLIVRVYQIEAVNPLNAGRAVILWGYSLELFIACHIALMARVNPIGTTRGFAERSGVLGGTGLPTDVSGKGTQNGCPPTVQ